MNFFYDEHKTIAKNIYWLSEKTEFNLSAIIKAKKPGICGQDPEPLKDQWIPSSYFRFEIVGNDQIAFKIVLRDQFNYVPQDANCKSSSFIIGTQEISSYSEIVYRTPKDVKEFLFYVGSLTALGHALISIIKIFF